MAGAVLSEAARAKVNLFLHVVGRRADGYHLLDSLAVFPAIGDVLRGEHADVVSLAVEGPFGGALAGEADNLVLRAARGLSAIHGVTAGARLVLDKRLPVASGIGGGSADAAAALRLLSRLWQVAVPAELAIALGADVPVCLGQMPSRMGGVGEVIGPGPVVPAFGMVLVNPGVAVATPAVFRARSATEFTSAACLPSEWPTAAAMARDLAATTNDLQDAAISLCPAIAEVLAALVALDGCRLARMSGSGATCFAVFDNAAAAVRAAALLAGHGWWIWGGEGNSSDG